jgi:phosphohistidine phosphatase SixA
VKQIILIRHGHTLNDALTICGQSAILDAAMKLPAVLAGRSVAAFVSPTGRTRESAAIISAHLGLHFEIRSDLHIVTFHDWSAHAAFAAHIRALKEEAILIVGHDETRPHVARIILEMHGVALAMPTRLGLGEILSFSDPSKGYILW